MIQINGVELPAPSGYTVGVMDISQAERNANGTIIIERIATKRKLSLSWSILSSEDLSNILNLVSSVFFNVEYVDPQDGGLRSGTFYSGDRNNDGVIYINNVMTWRNIKFDVIER